MQGPNLAKMPANFLKHAATTALIRRRENAATRYRNLQRLQVKVSFLTV